MGIFSLSYAAFVAVGLFAYYLIPQKAQWCVLLALSWGFYLTAGPRAMGYLLFVTASTYAAALFLNKQNRFLKSLGKEEREACAPAVKKKKRAAALLLMLANFGLLFFVKYWDFTAASFQRLGISLPSLGLLVPLGISYYMFQSVGYVIDVYRGKYDAQRNFFRYALFVSFFPQIIQGPIGRFDALAPQLFAQRRFSFENLKSGLQLALLGCLKKLVIADRAAVAVEKIYGDHQAYGGVMIAIGVLFYCIQLYCDFSGGIDIVRGVGRMFGVELTENFRRPIFAQSLTDFWRRWHISLGAWMKDYLFYPISLSKPILKFGKFSRKKIGGRLGKILPTSVATFLIYFVIGIWHGSSWKYIAFGFYNGILITSGLLLEPLFSRVREKLSLTDGHRGMKVFRTLRTCVLVFIGRYITRAGSLRTGVSMLWKTVRHPIPSQFLQGGLFSLGLTGGDLLVVGVGVLLLLVAEFLEERGKSLSERLDEKPFWVQWITMALGLFVLLLLGVFRGDYISAEFIYQQF